MTRQVDCRALSPSDHARFVCRLRAVACRAIARAAAADPAVTIGFVEIDGDPRYEPMHGLWAHDAQDPRASASPARRSGIDEAQALTRVLKTDFALERISVKSPAEVAPAVMQAHDSRRHPFLHRRCAGRGIQAAGRCRARAATCFCSTPPRRMIRCVAICARAEFVHTLPSLAMRMDGARAISGVAQVARSAGPPRPAAGRCRS